MEHDMPGMGDHLENDRHDDLFARLQSADPASELTVDLAALRTKIDALIAAEAVPAEGRSVAPVVSLDAARAARGTSPTLAAAARPRYRRWLLSAGAAAAAAVVGVGIVSGAVMPQDNRVSADGSANATKAPGQGGLPGLDGNMAEGFGTIAVPGAQTHLDQVGDVTFAAEGQFDTARHTAAAYRVTADGEVSTAKVSNVAKSLGLGGKLEKNGAGYTIKDPSGAKLVVTVGGLTTLSYTNPAAMKMECVPVDPNGESSMIELPRQDGKDEASTPSASVPSTQPSATPKTPAATVPPTTQPAEPTEQPSIELPKPTQMETPEGTLAPPVKPGQGDESAQPSASPSSTSSPSAQTDSSAVGQLNPAATPTVGATAAARVDATDLGQTEAARTYAQVAAVVPGTGAGAAGAVVPGAGAAGAAGAGHVQAPAPVRIQIAGANAAPAATPNPEATTAESTHSPSANPSTSSETMATPTPAPSCVMRAAGPAPDRETAIAQVNKVAAALGGTTQSSAAAVQSADGITTVMVPVTMPGQDGALTWKATVTANGVATISASLGKTKKVGDYQTISAAEAVERLNDPNFGPLDVTLPAGTSGKITGQIKLVKAQLSTAPVKQKDGSLLSLPVYLITDTQGRVWTVLAVAD